MYTQMLTPLVSLVLQAHDPTDDEGGTHAPSQQGPTQMYPYRGPQFSDEGLIKYGAVNVASHAERNAIDVASPNV